MNRWAIRATDPANTRWAIVFQDTQVGEILWVNDLDDPMRARAQIERSMNRALPSATARRSCWTFRATTTTGHPIHHNGVLIAELVWLRPPPATTDIWQAIVLAGLNYADDRVPAVAPARLRAKLA